MAKLIIFSRADRITRLFTKQELRSKFLKELNGEQWAFSLAIQNQQLSLHELDETKNIHFIWDGGKHYNYSDDIIKNLLIFLEDVIDAQSELDGTYFLMHTEPKGDLRKRLEKLQDRSYNKMIIYKGATQINDKFYGKLVKLIENNFNLNNKTIEEVEKEILDIFYFDFEKNELLEL